MAGPLIRIYQGRYDRRIRPEVIPHSGDQQF